MRLSDSTLSDWLTGRSVPARGARIRFLLQFLRTRAARSDPGLPPLEWWEQRRQAAWNEQHAKRGGRPRASKTRFTGDQPLTGLVDVVIRGELPKVAEIDPYTLGTTPSQYGNAHTYGQRDEYVSRRQDHLIAASLVSGRFVVLAGRPR